MLALSALLLGLLPQDSRPESAGGPMARFQALATIQKVGVLRRIAKRVEASPDPLLRQILALRPATAELPPLEAAPVHDPEEWAKGAAPGRSRMAADSPRHQQVRAAFPALPFLDDLQTAIVYDWRHARVARREQGLSYDSRFANALGGWPPDADLIVAHLLAEFDADDRQHKLAEYFEHAWADLEARVYLDVTLFEAWCSGSQVDVPDVDAIPFATKILSDRTFVSPIPAGARRTRLYEQIRTAAAEHRRYRSVVICAAVAALRAEPILDKSYADLVPRFHLAWVEAGGNLETMTRLVADAARDRDAFIAKTDAAVIREPAVLERRERRKRDLLAIQHLVTDIATQELGIEK